MSSLGRAGLTALAYAALGASAGAQTILDSGHWISPAAHAQLAAICPTGNGYPAAWDWNPTQMKAAPDPATSGTPRIEQWRAGALVATYTTFSDQPTCTYKGDGTDWQTPSVAASTGCGPFTRVHAYRLWAPGDTFLVYPAVYSGAYNNPYFGAQYDGWPQYQAGHETPMTNLTISGVVQNNTRPVITIDGWAGDNALNQGLVYFDASDRLSFTDIDVMAQPDTIVGKGGIYEYGASNLTIARVRVSGFQAQSGGANGIFGAGGYSGWLLLDQVELDHNGGDNGPTHNAYINASLTDAHFTVHMRHSWSHDVVYGHLFKSRAQRTIMVGNYFEGGTPQPGQTQADTYLLDVPNGGELIARNNIFVKNASGNQSNGLSVTFAMEGIVDNRPQMINVENNTFVALSKTFDGYHQNAPFNFFYPSSLPGKPGWPSGVATRVIKNAFIGYCPSSSAYTNYRGSIDVTEAFAELTESYQLTNKVATDDAVLAATFPNYWSAVGKEAYAHAMLPVDKRKASTIGAQD